MRPYVKLLWPLVSVIKSITVVIIVFTQVAKIQSLKTKIKWNWSCWDAYHCDGRPFMCLWCHLTNTIKNSAVSPADEEKLDPTCQGQTVTSPLWKSINRVRPWKEVKYNAILYLHVFQIYCQAMQPYVKLIWPLVSVIKSIAVVNIVFTQVAKIQWLQTTSGQSGPLLRAKFHPHRCNVIIWNSMSCAPRNGLMSGWGGIRKTIIICPQCAFRVKEYGFRILSCTTGDWQFCFIWNVRS